MTTELAERLRKAAMDCAGSPLEEAAPICRLMDEAADEIERLAALSPSPAPGVETVERLRAALEPFAALGKRKVQYCIQPDDPIILEAIRALG